jgi:hypothetical protein
MAAATAVPMAGATRGRRVFRERVRRELVHILPYGVACCLVDAKTATVEVTDCAGADVPYRDTLDAAALKGLERIAGAVGVVLIGV